MKADFSRISFDPAQQYTAVLHQQGRIITDADLNEQSSIQMHYIESLAASLTGNEGAIWLDPNAEPPEGRRTAPRPVELRHLPGFRIVKHEAAPEVQQYLRGYMPTADTGKMTEAQKLKWEKVMADTKQERDEAAAQADALAGADWWISPGHYYAGGLRCENDAWVPVKVQPFLPAKLSEQQEPVASGKGKEDWWLFYLDAWERPLSWLDVPRISDVALGAAVDTAMRAQLVWQVKGLRLPVPQKYPTDEDEPQPPLPWDRPQPRLRVRIKPGATSKDPCRPAFTTAWQGQENLLYRVEIHDGTPPPSTEKPEDPKQGNYTIKSAKRSQDENGESKKDKKGVTFKWSRENGSVAARVQELKGAAVIFFPGQLKAGGFRKGDRVELVKNDDELSGVPGPMFIVDKVQGDSLTCETNADGKEFSAEAHKDDKLRRWDQKPCGETVIAVEHEWVELEHGIEVLFEPATDATLHDPELQKHQPAPACLADTEFRTGDYWVFTARTADASVDWPMERKPDETFMDFDYSAAIHGDVVLTHPQKSPPVPVRLAGLPALTSKPAALPPHGIRHRYAVLALAMHNGETWDPLHDLRRILHLCGEPARYEQPAPPPPAQDTSSPPLKDADIQGLTVGKNPAKRIFALIQRENPKAMMLRDVAGKAKEIERGRMEKAAKALEARLVKDAGTVSPEKKTPVKPAKPKPVK